MFNTGSVCRSDRDPRPDQFRWRRFGQPEPGPGDPGGLQGGPVVPAGQLGGRDLPRPLPAARGYRAQWETRSVAPLRKPCSSSAGLSAFSGTELESLLRDRGLSTLAVCGFMANCCVESTVRAACDLGFNVVTVIDCVATTSQANIWTS